eukprot:CAMPEP_0198225946 /NCGR_PEP_ID=MMETSP1445-20131203/103204_1 /TAXON_ID=36898 /ORGANISM="Pyramimonas sp., Strain CCMP2087" /LENGTH=206 /DNA_ID=CAMNT_0043905631 /DNA_START=179 /DNA_END=796 /DNA_ORIENTATION=-
MIKLGRLQSPNVGSGQDEDVCCCEINAEENLVATGCEDGHIVLYDAVSRKPCQQISEFEGKAVSSLCFSPVHSHVLYAASGSVVSAHDLRMGGKCEAVQRYEYNTDDVNQIVVNRKGTVLAAADDNGEVKVINLEKHNLQKTLSRGGHANICSSVQFRPHQPWEVISGGLDSSMVHWDFNAGRVKYRWNMGAEAATEGGAQMFNPP